MSASSKHRQPRLRASCDGCFLAKVKCSKARPICSRCLACGIECRYSPSSRAGKPKSDASSHLGHNHSNSHHHNTSPVADMAAMAAAAGFSSMTDEKGMVYTTTMPGMGWHNTTGMDGHATTSSRHHSIASELAMLSTDDNNAVMTSGGDVYDTSMPWTPPADMSMAQFTDSSLNGVPMVSHAGYSMHASASAGMPWMDPSAIDVFPYGNNGHGQTLAHNQHQMPTPASSISSANNYFPSPSTTPILRQSPTSGHKSVPLSSPSASSHHGSNSSSYQGCFQGACACFASCLHSLQALHNASTPATPPFDVVLALNRSAVDGCSAMLSCSRCMSRSGTHTAAMLLATVIGKVTSFYKNASQSYFTGDSATASSLDSIVGGLDYSGPSAVAAADSSSRQASISSPPAPSSMLTGLGVSLGAYHLQGEEGRWFELEILNRELKKLEDVYSRFREVCGELSEDVEVSKAMIGYLGNNLGSTLNMVSHSKGDMRYI
ncbi:transcription factor [Ophiostoma piceae UAMH 11346]|uniref:Transcription factor n=1 Tax=Ophiostoma piceae (strain UAMH 11346) TaxID=1262450 RepID=S3CVB3_OPHP1|nr:transcription factor [Ophiostoma piceae UAMH 11346]